MKPAESVRDTLSAEQVEPSKHLPPSPNTEPNTNESLIINNSYKFLRRKHTGAQIEGKPCWADSLNENADRL